MGNHFVMSVGLILSTALVGCAPHGADSGSAGGSGDKMTMSSPATQPSAAVYTCTMHPDVVSNTPGKCPKCSMDLVAKK